MANVYLSAIGAAQAGTPPTSVSLFDQGLLQVLQAAVSGLEPKRPYVLALADKANASGPLEPLSNFMTNPAGAAVVNAIGQIRELVAQGTSAPEHRRYLVIAPVTDGKPGSPVQLQRM
ncbi:CTP:molybdopterin cytidylyltransferase MocA [Paraburkholderia sp. JPY681]|nr:CTP:molybdopterin cytidylyltransferase MocA [Paraburkholderia atlantica]